MRTIGQRELRNDNAKIIDQVVAGASFLVTRNGVPVAELRPVTSTARRRMVPRAAIVDTAQSGPTIDGARFRADLDRAADQSL